MGIFQTRPEDPTEWTGLPSEPWQPRSPVEQLGDAPNVEYTIYGDPVGVETIAIALTPAAPAAVESGDAGGDGD